MRTFKCAVLFFSAALLHGIGHDVAQAVAAWGVGIPSTLYHFFVLFDVPTTNGAPMLGAREVVVIYGAPVVFSAIVSLAGAWVYDNVRSAAAALFALYFAAFGAIGVLSSVLSTPISGGPHNIALVLDVPIALQIGLSVPAGLMLIIVMWLIGSRLQPPAGTLVVPFVAATAARLLVYAPMPWPMAGMLLGGSAVWLVAIAGSVWEHRRARRAGRSSAPLPPVNLALSAMVLPVFLILVVRLMTMGVRFGG